MKVVTPQQPVVPREPARDPRPPANERLALELLPTIRAMQAQVVKLERVGQGWVHAGPSIARGSLRDVRRLIVIVASSRSGSSLLFQLLAASPGVLSLDGEHSAIYRLNQIGWQDGREPSDALDHVTDAQARGFERDFLAQLGRGPELPCQNPQHLADLLTIRMPIQWPRLHLSRQDWRAYVDRAMSRASRERGGGSAKAVFAAVLNGLIEDGHAVSPAYYDGAACDTLPPPDPDFVLEEPPFVRPRLRAAPLPNELATLPVLLKSSVDAYRLPVVRQLFPNAELRVIHLTRNPAASVNGLVDGWLDRGFFSHQLREHAELVIAGYSDRFPWGAHWWNFDLPADWRRVIGHPLEYVCGHQWRSAHASILGAAPRHADRMLWVRFEDLLGSDGRRRDTLREVYGFMGIQVDHDVVSSNFPVVMSTQRPEIRRWLARRDTIWPVVSQPEVREVAAELGYHREDYMAWL